MTLTYLELYRRKSGMTIKQLAFKAGYVPNAISQIECGHRPSWPLLRSKIAEALEVPEKELFNIDGSIKKVQIQILIKMLINESAKGA